MKPSAGLFTLAMALSAIIGARADSLPPQDRLAHTRTIISASRRFMVSGLPAARAAELARWADEVAERIQRQAGPLPFERGQYILIAADESDAPSTVEPQQTCEQGDVAQTLVLRGLDGIDLEQAEEALGALLVNRYAQALQPAAERCSDPARVSDWLVVALVHASNPVLRRRNLDFALARHQSGELTPFAELVEQHAVPAGRWPQKADAMALWLWLSESPRASAMLVEAFRLQAEGRKPDATWWAEQRIGTPNPEAAARAWSNWLEARQVRARPLASGDVNTLLAMRFIPAHELDASGGPRALADQPLSALIPHQKEPWCRQVAIRHALRIRLEAIGHEEEAQLVAEAHAAFLDRLARGDSRRRLNVLWKQAEERSEQYTALLDARRRYLDAVEDRLGTPRPPPDPVTRYLDEIEARIGE